MHMYVFMQMCFVGSVLLTVGMARSLGPDLATHTYTCVRVRACGP